jgi:hypothetical protein
LGEFLSREATKGMTLNRSDIQELAIEGLDRGEDFLAIQKLLLHLRPRPNITLLT